MEHALESVRSSIYSPFCTVASKTRRAHNFASMHACTNTPHVSHGYGKTIMEPAGEEIPRPAAMASSCLMRLRPLTCIATMYRRREEVDLTSQERERASDLGRTRSIDRTPACVW